MTSPSGSTPQGPSLDRPSLSKDGARGDASDDDVTGRPGENDSAPDTASADGTTDTAATGESPAATPSGRRRGRRATGERRQAKKRPLWIELPVLVIIALALALLIKTFVVQPFYIPSGSMEKTLNVNDRVLVNKMIYHFRDPKRGEIVVFNIEGTGFERAAQPLAPPSNIVSRAVRNVENLFGLGPNNKDFIKRVIGIGGDTVACCDTAGRVTVNGKALDEPYVYDDDHRPFGPVKVPRGQLWVMGDHRGDSDDSRGSPGQGPNGFVPVSKVVGQAFVRVWPLSDWRGYGVPKTFSQFSSSAALPELGVVLPVLLIGRRRRGAAGRRTWRLPAVGGAPPAPPGD